MRCVKRLKWPCNKRVDPAQALAFAGLGAVFLVAVAGILATLDASKPHYRWAWPTNWMAVPAAVVVIGLGLLVVPVKRLNPDFVVLDSESGATYCIPLVCAELEQWRQFLTVAAGNGWINFFDQMPPSGALLGDDGSVRHAIPEAVKVSLLKVYRYFAALTAAHDRIDHWKKDSVESTAASKSKDETLAEVTGGIIGQALAQGTIYTVRYLRLESRLKRAQLTKHEYRSRLSALPGILAELQRDLDSIRAGVLGSSKTQPMHIDLPEAPAVEVSKHGSIDFILTPVNSY